MWVLSGFVVACCWVILGVVVGPNINLGRSAIVAITAPAAYLGRRVPLAYYWFILLNAAIYALLGLAIELVRRPFTRHLAH
jgi:hypothetical protein